MVAWRNSLVLHSLDKVTSIYIHFFPALLAYSERWHGCAAAQEGLGFFFGFFFWPTANAGTGVLPRRRGWVFFWIFFLAYSERWHGCAAAQEGLGTNSEKYRMNFFFVFRTLP
jgi:hypothetical protein